LSSFRQKIKMCKKLDDIRRTSSNGKSSHGLWSVEIKIYIAKNALFKVRFVNVKNKS
jgi:hypothetical protein